MIKIIERTIKMNKHFIPFSSPVIGDEEINEVINTLKSGWLTTGEKTKQFEADFEKFIGCKYAIAVNSATAGLHLALESIGVRQGDAVITTTHTFTATAEVIRYLGADPVFVDVDEHDFNISVKQIEDKLKSHTNIKAIIPVHFAGQACKMKEISELARKYEVKIVEDAAHALPTKVSGNLIGSESELCVFSFYANKTITTGEGGMVVTNNPELAKRMKMMRLHGINRDVFDRFTSNKPNWYYEVVAPGFKYNLTDLASSIGIHQLKKANQFHQRRCEIVESYNSRLSKQALILPKKVEPEDVHSWHLYVVRLNTNKISRDELLVELGNRGVGTSVHYMPLHMHPYWKKTYDLNDDSFPVSSRIFKDTFTLPNYPSMTDADVDHVINVLNDILK